MGLNGPPELVELLFKMVLSTYYFSTHTFDLHFQVVYKYDWDCPRFNINILFIFIYVHEDDGQMISPMLLSIQEAHNRLYFLPFLLLQKSISNTTECKKRVHCIGDVLTEECDVSNKIGIKSLFFWYWMNLRVPWLTFGIFISYRYVLEACTKFGHHDFCMYEKCVEKCLTFLNWFRLNLFYYNFKFFVCDFLMIWIAVLKSKSEKVSMMAMAMAKKAKMTLTWRPRGKYFLWCRNLGT